MKKIFSVFIAIYIAGAFTCRVSAQEQIVPLEMNPIIAADKSISSSSLRNVITLPFVDDFSYSTIYPDPNLWIGTQAFVNSTFPVNPPSIGVATLDGLNQFGHPYDSVTHSFFSVGGADTLTSQPIVLSGFSAADSIYMSFFYQPGGVGDVPNSTVFNLANFSLNFGDSLVLEFKSDSGVWKHIWAQDGIPYQSFRQVMIPVRDSIFFHDVFQFRFRNYATRIGQYDCWNIDYVKIGASRIYNDTTVTDVAIQYLPTTILKNYQAMPWNQFINFQGTEKADQQFLSVKNNFNVVKNTSSQMSAFEAVNNTPIFTSTPSSQNLDPKSSTVISFPSFPINDFPGMDSVVIATPFVVKATGDNNIANDSITRFQVFSNYMAYDDGTPEAIYRLLGSPASLAVQYHLNVPDTLRAIQILFAHSEVNLASNLFSLFVWKSLNPEDSLLRDEFILPGFSDTINGFAYYRLSRPLAISDTFYIGWQQVSLQSDLKMDVGFDLNDDAHQHLFYNVDGTWTQSSFPGAIMIRPVLGSNIPFQSGIPGVIDADEFTVFPNPSSDFLFIEGGSKNLFLTVVDLTGKMVMEQSGVSKMEIRNLPSGMYLLRISDLTSGKSSVRKFFKAN